MKNTISWANLDGYAEKVRQYHQRREAQKIFLSVASELQNARDEQLAHSLRVSGVSLRLNPLQNSSNDFLSKSTTTAPKSMATGNDR